MNNIFRYLDWPHLALLLDWDLMGRILPPLVLLALTIFAVVDLAQTDAYDVPHMPKWMWALLVIFVPGIGPLSWLIVSHLSRAETKAARDKERPPDDDDDWLGKL